jgi:hypothetical protein
LYGKKAPQEKITKEIKDLLSGNAARPYPLTIAEIARVLGDAFQYLDYRKLLPMVCFAILQKKYFVTYTT